MMTQGYPEPRSTRKRSSLGMMMVLVACVAVLLWRWRDVSGSRAAFDLARTIGEGSSKARSRALDDLYRVSADHAWTAMPALFSALDDSDPDVRARSTASLFYLMHETDRPDQIEVVREKLFTATKNPDPIVRAWALDLLNSPKISPTSAKPPADLTDLLKQAALDPDGRVREMAYVHLEKRAVIGPEQECLLVRAASDRAPRVRAFAIRRLVALSNRSRAALLVVVRALNDPSGEVRTAAASGYFIIPASVSREALPELIQAFRAWKPGPYEPSNPQSQNRWSVRSRILSILNSLGPAANSAAPALIEQLPMENAVAFDLADYEVIKTLGALAPDSAEAKACVPGLVDILTGRKFCSDRDRSFAFSAIDTLKWDPRIIAALREVAAGDDRDDDSRMAKAILKSLPNAQEDAQP